MVHELVQLPEKIEALFKVGAHFAFSKSRRHPSMARYIFGTKNKVEIFDLEKVFDLLEETKEYMRECGVARKTVLFVSGKNEAKAVIAKVAEEIEQPYVAGRWIGGTLTNFSEIKKRLQKLRDFKEQKEKGELSKYTKLEQLYIDREIEDLEKTFGGIQKMENLPDVVLVVDSRHEEIAVSEAKKLNIPLVGIVNSDCNTADTDHFVACNDSSVASITYILNELVASYKEGLEKAPKPKSEEVKKEKPTTNSKK